MNLTDKALELLRGFKEVGEMRAFLAGYEAGQETVVIVPRKEVPPEVRLEAKPMRRPRVMNRGLQATVLRLLYTGPATEAALIESTELKDRTAVLTALHRLRTMGLVLERAISGTRYCELTEQGKVKAEYFHRNPHAKLFHG